MPATIALDNSAHHADRCADGEIAGHRRADMAPDGLANLKRRIGSGQQMERPQVYAAAWAHVFCCQIRKGLVRARLAARCHEVPAWAEVTLGQGNLAIEDSFASSTTMTFRS